MPPIANSTPLGSCAPGQKMTDTLTEWTLAAVLCLAIQRPIMTGDYPPPTLFQPFLSFNLFFIYLFVALRRIQQPGSYCDG